jgi:hypothetical protein
VLADPQLTVYAGLSAKLASNDNWGGSQTLADVAHRLGAFPLAATSTDAALVQSVSEGLYSAEATSTAGSGVVLVEAYDADTGQPAAKFVNCSVRSFSGPNERVLTMGFSITGDGPRQVLIRGIGPGLAPFGVSGLLADPQITVYQGTQVVAGNDNWSGDATMKAAFQTTGAFGLPAGSADAAIILTLLPGSYSVQVSGANDSSGVALAEVYELP